jgi:WD40 repeat protein
VTALAFNPDGTQLATPGYHEINIWNVADGSLAHRIGGLPERINSIVWDRKQNLIAAAGGSPAQWGTVALVDPSAGFQVRFLCDLPETALTVAFSPDGKSLVAGCGDRTIRLFEIPGGRQTRLWRQHADWVQSVAFSPDGKDIVSGSRDRTARVFNAATGELESTYSGHDTPLVDVVFSTTGSSVFSVAHGKSLHMWETKSGNRQAEITGLSGEVQRIAVEESRLITIASDGLVRVHQLNDRIPLFTLFGHRDAVEAIALSPVGDHFATGSHDGEVFIWETTCGTWIQHFVASPLTRTAR